MDSQKEVETLIGYADDSSTYGQIEANDRTEEKTKGNLIYKVEKRERMRLNRLKMNDQKMEFIKKINWIIYSLKHLNDWNV